MEGSNIKIVVVDDHTLFREGLRSLLERTSKYEVVGEAENGRAAIAVIEQLQPDIILMDIGMPDLNGIDATRMILAKCPSVKIIAVSIHSDRRYLAGMFQVGAVGYLLKECAFEELHAAIASVMEGKIYLSPQITGILVGDYIESLDSKPPTDHLTLTSQERLVLQMISEGKSVKDIAHLLHLSVKTIETHRKRIMDKLNIRSIAELTKFAVREGITSL